MRKDKFGSLVINEAMSFFNTTMAILGMGVFGYFGGFWELQYGLDCVRMTWTCMLGIGD